MILKSTLLELMMLMIQIKFNFLQDWEECLSNMEFHFPGECQLLWRSTKRSKGRFKPKSLFYFINSIHKQQFSQIRLVMSKIIKIYESVVIKDDKNINIRNITANDINISLKSKFASVFNLLIVKFWRFNRWVFLKQVDLQLFVIFLHC